MRRSFYAPAPFPDDEQERQRIVSALLEIGERKRGHQLCERLLSLASPLDLYAEELDAATGRHLGNFPQAFTHLALINAVMHDIRDEQANPIS